jgi:hypothetical protein
MESPLDQLIQSLEQITQQLQDLECIFGSTAALYSQRKFLRGQNVVKLGEDVPDTLEEG